MVLLTKYTLTRASGCLAFLSLNQTPRRESRLFCRYYDNNRNPKFLLSPVKQQDEWDRPYIVRYLDIISDSEIEMVKKLAKPRVSSSLYLQCKHEAIMMHACSETETLVGTFSLTKLIRGREVRAVSRAHGHIHLCHVCVCAWVNHVPGFTATQGHHLQPHHRSAGDGSLPDQQEVRCSQGPPGTEERAEGEEVRVSPHSVTRRFSLLPAQPCNLISPPLQCFKGIVHP